MPNTPLPADALAHLLAGRGRFSYGTMRMAQRAHFPGGLYFAKVRLACAAALFFLAMNDAHAADPHHELLAPQGNVELLRKGAQAWVVAKTNLTLFAGDAVRTGKDSRAAVRLSNDSVIRLDQLTVMRFPEPATPRKRFLVNLLKGAIYFFHRERPVQTDFETPLVSGAIRGTEFNLAVADNGRTVLTRLDGEVAPGNPQGQLALRGGEQAVVEPAGPPRKTAALQADNIIQWTLYYPAVLDPNELTLSTADRQALADSFAAYRDGALPQALAAYPPNRQPGSSAEKIYLAQLELSAGQLENAARLLDSLPENEPRSAVLVAALRTLIAAVKLQPASTNAISGSPSL